MGNPITKIQAMHSPKAAKNASPEQAQQLKANLFLCVGARVLLPRNLCIRQGLANGSFGTVRAIIYGENSELLRVLKIFIFQNSQNSQNYHKIPKTFKTQNCQNFHFEF